MQAAEVLNLSIAERIQLVEDIWDTIGDGVNYVDVSDEEKLLIDERLTAFHQNPFLGSPWRDVLKRI